jgi:hypothetical protein
MALCSIAGCSKATVGRGFCDTHYRRFRRYGDPLKISRLAPGTHLVCSVDGCGRKHMSLGYCNKHLIRFKKYGDPLVVQFEPAPNGAPYRWITEVAIPFAGDECLPFPFAKAKGYGYFWHAGVKYAAHRYVCQGTHGAPPSGRYAAAHACGNPACVNPRHLTWKTYAENEADKLAHGTYFKRSNKLTSADVVAIRQTEGTHTSVAAEYGVSRRLVGMIKSRKLWSWVP